MLSPTLNRRVPVWNVETGKTICAFNKHEGYVMRAVFSPDGKEALSGGHDMKPRVWDSTTAVQRLEIDHPEVICAVAVTPDGRFALTGTGGELPKNALAMTMTRGTDNVLRMWDLSNGKLVRDMKGHSHAIFAIDVSPDGRFAVSGGWDGWIRVWDLQSGDEVAQSQGESSVMDVKFSPMAVASWSAAATIALPAKKCAGFPTNTRGCINWSKRKPTKTTSDRCVASTAIRSAQRLRPVVVKGAHWSGEANLSPAGGARSRPVGRRAGLRPSLCRPPTA